MSLQFPCPCGRLLQVSADLGGKRVRCPSCSRIVWAPASPESIPEARLVDNPQAPRIEPVAARVAQPETPMAREVPAQAPSPAPESGGRCATKHDCGAVGGFILSLGSLAFGIVACPLFIISWPVGGAVGALVSCSALRRIRAGRGNPASAGLARAGVAIGVGQLLLSLVLIAAVFAIGVKEGRGCCGGGRARYVPPAQTTIHESATKPQVEQKQEKEIEVETTEEVSED